MFKKSDNPVCKYKGCNKLLLENEKCWEQSGIFVCCDCFNKIIESLDLKSDIDSLNELIILNS